MRQLATSAMDGYKRCNISLPAMAHCSCVYHSGRPKGSFQYCAHWRSSPGRSQRLTPTLCLLAVFLEHGCSKDVQTAQHVFATRKGDQRYTHQSPRSCQDPLHWQYRRHHPSSLGQVGTVRRIQIPYPSTSLEYVLTGLYLDSVPCRK